MLSEIGQGVLDLLVSNEIQNLEFIDHRPHRLDGVLPHDLPLPDLVGQALAGGHNLPPEIDYHFFEKPIHFHLELLLEFRVLLGHGLGARHGVAHLPCRDLVDVPGEGVLRPER